MNTTRKILGKNGVLNTINCLILFNDGLRCLSICLENKKSNKEAIEKSSLWVTSFASETSPETPFKMWICGEDTMTSEL